MTSRPHRLTVSLLLLCALLCALAAGVIIARRQARLRGALNGLPDADLPYRVPVAGVSADLTQYEPEALSENLDLIEEAGFTWVRQVFTEEEIEAERGVYDRVIDAIAARDLRLAAVLECSPDDMGGCETLAAALAGRYGDRIDVYQIGDDPPADPAGYAALLEAAYDAIHSTDQDALVMAAVPGDALYLRALYDVGAGRTFDGVAGELDAPDAVRFLALREEMERHGDRHKPLWASGVVWGEPPEAVAMQAGVEWVSALYERALVEWPWSGALFPVEWPPGAPTVEALRRNAGRFNGVLWPGLYPAQTGLADYSGEWEFSELGVDFSEGGNSVVEVPFVGDTLAVIVRRGHYRAHLYVEVDGQPSRILPRDERGAYLILTSPDYQPHVEILPVASGYGGGQRHVARLEAERGWDQWALVGFAVGSRVDTRPYDTPTAVLILLAVASLSAAIWLGRDLRPVGALGRAATWVARRLRDGLRWALSLAASVAAWLEVTLTLGGSTARLGDLPTLLIAALAAAIFHFAPWPPLAVGALVVLFILIYARLDVGLALIMFFTPYYLLPRPLFGRAFSLLEVTSLLTLLAWGVWVVAARKEKGWPTPGGLWLQMTPLDRAAGFFVLLAVVSLSWASLRDVAVTELRQMVLEPFVVYLVLRTTPLTDRQRWRIVDLLVLTGVVVALVGFYQIATGIDVITAEAGARRLKSVLGTPNNTALFLGRITPIAAAVVVIGGERRRRWLYAAACVVMILATALTLSKGGLLLALPAGLGLVVVLWLGRRGLIAVAAALAVEALALIPLSRMARFAGLFDFTSPTSTTLFRLRLWKSTLRMIRDHPLTGVGLDQFLYAYRGHYILPEAWRQPDLSQPHNFLLNYWARLGILGLVVGVAMQIAFWRTAWVAQKRFKGSDAASRALVVGLMGGMAAFVAHGLVDEVHFVIDLAFIFFMSLGLVHQVSEG